MGFSRLAGPASYDELRRITQQFLLVDCWSEPEILDTELNRVRRPLLCSASNRLDPFEFVIQSSDSSFEAHPEQSPSDPSSP